MRGNKVSTAKKEIGFNSNVSSSKQPMTHLIPTVAMVRTAQIFELGKLIKKEKAWNATSTNQDCLMDKEFLLDRISHIINHALKLRDKILVGDMMDGEDDAASIVFGGMLLICATDREGFEKDVRFSQFDNIGLGDKKG